MSVQKQNQTQGKKPKKIPESTDKPKVEVESEETIAFGLTDPALLHDDRVPAANRQALAQELGRLHGNRTLQRYLDKDRSGTAKSSSTPEVQRGLLDIFGGVAEMTIDAIFREVVSSNVADSSNINIPEDWPTIVREYAAANPDDSSVLLRALARSPSYHSGGWIMDIQPDAAAMTLDRDVFVSGDLDLATYVHELVHVTQYGGLGPTAFLVSYFGLSAATIARRLINREPLNIMRSSPHEEAAYQLEERFIAWHRREKGADPRGIKP